MLRLCSKYASVFRLIFIALRNNLKRQRRYQDPCKHLRRKSLQQQIAIKGYLHYKTITSQNVPFEAQVNNFFVS